MELLNLGNNFTPGGGAWIYPYSKSLVDFGFGVLNTQMERSLKSYTSSFMNNSLIWRKLKGGKIIEEDGGFIPATGPLKKPMGTE